MKLTDETYKKIVILNITVTFFLFCLTVLWFIWKKDDIRNKVQNLIQKEIQTSTFSQDVLKVAESQLLQYSIKINPIYLRDMQILVKKMSKQKIMFDEDKKWYPIKFFDEIGNEFNAKIRMRGDLSGHWENAKKSWRIKFSNDNLFNGYKQLNFVVPDDKAYEVEKIAYDFARTQDLIAPDSGFVKIALNGVDMGLYFWFEQNSKEMLEKLRYPEGEIFREKNTWVQTRFTGFGLHNLTPGVSLFPGNYASTIQQEGSKKRNNAEKWNYFLTLIREGAQEKFTKEIPHLLNIEKYLKWNALTWLFGSTHAHWGDNLRWYYNNTTGLFEPIIYDVYRYPIDNLRKGTFEAKEYDPLAKRLLKEDMFRQKRNAILWDYVNNKKFYMDNLSEREYQKIEGALLTGVDAKPLSEVKRFHEETIAILKNNRKSIKAHLEFARVFVTPSVNTRGQALDISFKILPDSMSRIGLEEIEIVFTEPIDLSNKEINFSYGLSSNSMEEIKPKSIKNFENKLIATFDDLDFVTPVDNHLIPYPKEFQFGFKISNIKSLELSKLKKNYPINFNFVNRISNQKIKTNYIYVSDTMNVSDTEEILNPLIKPIDLFIKESKIPFKVADKNLLLDPGEYIVKKDLIIPADYGLIIRDGVRLKFAPNASIMMFRSLKIQGTEANPVIFEALEKELPWGTFAIITAEEKSEIESLIVSGGSEDTLNGIYSSGQLSFYQSDVDIKNSTFINAKADDSLNIKNAYMKIDKCLFEGNTSDAFDGDWVEGKIENSIFRANKGDGIDFSGSTVISKNNVFEGIGDKAISVGEDSTFYAVNNYIYNSKIGVAGKDSSDVKIYSSLFYKNQTALTLYQKKQVFNGGVGLAVSSLFWDNSNDFTIDNLSELELIGVGSSNKNVDPKIRASDLRIANLSDYYTISDDKKLRFTGKKGSLFSSGPSIEPQLIFNTKLPNLNEFPVGPITK